MANPTQLPSRYLRSRVAPRGIKAKAIVNVNHLMSLLANALLFHLYVDDGLGGRGVRFQANLQDRKQPAHLMELTRRSLPVRCSVHS